MQFNITWSVPWVVSQGQWDEGFEVGNFNLNVKSPIIDDAPRANKILLKIRKPLKLKFLILNVSHKMFYWLVSYQQAKVPKNQ